MILLKANISFFSVVLERRWIIINFAGTTDGFMKRLETGC